MITSEPVGTPSRHFRTVRVLVSLAAVALVGLTVHLILLGCASTAPVQNAEGRGQEGFQQAPRAPQYRGAIPLRIVNDTPAELCRIRMSPSTAAEWSDNWLNPGEHIRLGEERMFPIPGSPSWDIEVSSCEGNVIAVRRGMAVSGPIRLGAALLVGAQPGGFAGGGVGQ